ncbi:MAG: hypothetical protein EOO88_00115 [Pedobacter sp.]|nr:MAG: hypothetical protein EOO88_00115 [Pedobacter sp.]
MKYKILVYMAITLFPIYATAQQQESMAIDQKRLQFSLGVQKLSLIDASKSPLIYTARAIPSVGIGYERQTSDQVYGAGLQLSYGGFGAKNLPPRNVIISSEDLYGKVSRNPIPAQGNILNGEINLYYLKRISKAYSKYTLYLGGRLSDEIYYPSGSINAGNPVNFASLAAQAKVIGRMNNRNEVGLQAHLPLLSLVTRDPFDGTFSEPGKSLQHSFFSKGSKFRSLDTYQSIQLGIWYQYLASNRWGFKASGIAGWKKLNEPAKFRSVNSQAVLQINYNLSK